MTEPRHAGIIWKDYNQTLQLLKENPRPIFAFVLDEDGTCWPFLREIFRALPRNQKLQELLNGPCVPMLVKADALPPYLEELETLGPVKGYHIAILSPAGFTPVRSFDYVTNDPDSLVKTITGFIEQTTRAWNT